MPILEIMEYFSPGGSTTMKKVLSAVCIFLAFVPALFAFGSKDTIETPAKSLESWLETVDVSGQKPGKYNILVTAEDLAGNQAFGGPYNMYIDPESDLPVTRATNPLQDMRVPGNLNIVGTCIDDDEVAYVELLLDDSTTPVRAQGKTFWSYYLDTNGLTEGPHTISVYGVDVNGVQGKPYKVRWHLDRNRPETSVSSPGMGALVSGKFSISGSVTDGNGIKALAYSLDGGKTFIDTSIKHDKDAGLWNFAFGIDTIGMKDGPSVCWFKATDGQGSQGIFTFLYFVDNTKPEVGFISPDPTEAVNGKFSVSGYASDVIGISSLTWKAGKDTGAFEVIKGNPYWVKEFDVTGMGSGSFDVEITAVDVAGNKTSAIRKIAINPALDVPSLTVLTPQNGEIVMGDVRLSGTAVDDDGIAAVWFSLNKAPPEEIATPGSFAQILAGLPAGGYQLELWPVDVFGTRGQSTFLSFASGGTPPIIEVEPLAAPYGELHPESGAELKAAIRADAGLRSLTWSLTGLPEQSVPIKEGTKDYPLVVKIRPDMPYGLLSFEVKAVDVHGREAQSIVPVYLTNLSIPRDEAPAAPAEALKAQVEVMVPAGGKNPPVPGLASIAIERVVGMDTPFENGMLLTLPGPAAPKAEQRGVEILVGIDSPLPVSAVTWKMADGEGAKASFKKVSDTRYEAILPFGALTRADWIPFGVEAALKDGTTLAASGLVCVVRPAPAAGIFDDERFAWGTARRNQSGSILLFDGVRASGLYNGKKDRFAKAAEFDKPVKGLSLSLEGNTVTVEGTADGEYPGVVISITDSQGQKFKTPPVTFVVDSGLPTLTVDTSARPYWLQNSLPVKGSANDSRGVSVVEYSLDRGASWEPFRGADFDSRIDVSAIPDGPVDLIIRATDRSGRTTEDWRVFMKDTTPPVAEAVFPAPGDVVNGETRIGFRASDAGRLVKAEYRAPGDRSAKDRTEYMPIELSSLTNTVVGTLEKPLSERMEFRFTDESGNSSSVTSWLFKVDAKADLPIVEIHLPAENDVIRKDFVISGVVYDDDEPAKVWYKIDNGAFTEVASQHSFSVPIALKSLTDNEHTITMYAEDIHGVRGEQVVRKIRVSLEEPKAAVQAPSFETTNRGVIDITGVASDKNGIAKVEVSLDNGNSFNLAEGTESWKYRFDTRVIQDGTHVVFIRVYDKYETTGLYSSLVNIDNTAPSLRLELPLDGSRTGETLFISGQTLDNIGLKQVRAKISNIDPKQPSIPAAYVDIPFDNEMIISRGLDIKQLQEGFYNIELRGFDHAGNVTRISRNFEVYRGKDRNRIEFLYPLNGEKQQGVFNVYGRVVSEEPVEGLLLLVDGENVASAELSPSGYYKFVVTPEMVADGTRSLVVNALVAGNKMIASEPHSVIYQAAGPWVAIDNLAMGDFAIDRPWLMGTAGYSFTEDEALALRSKETPKEERRRLEAKAVKQIDISFDNGKSFVKTESGKKWRYRIETGDLHEGYHFMVVRALMQNGEVAVTRSIVQIDKTAPTVRLISPGEGGRYNNELVFSGLSSDDVELESVMLALRPGDKSRYAVPAFIQGLYFDWHFWGATLYDIGVGLTFFDSNVKIQAQFGQFTAEQRAIFTTNKMRYGGNVFGVKMLANVAYFPMDYFFGPDFSWLSTTAAVGANFSVFSETQSGQPQILSAALIQIEFPRVTLPKRKTFKTFSMYTEAQFWFIPTDVDSAEVSIQSVLPHVTAGFRLNVF